MQLIVITGKEKLHSEIPVIIDLFRAGLKTLHVRKPKFSTEKLSEYLEAIPEQYHNRIIIHTHHKLALKFNLKGIHLSKHHRNSPLKLFLKLNYYKMRKPSLFISRSFHQVETMGCNKKKFHYAFLNPFFSRVDLQKNSFDINPNYLGKMIAACGCPIYASGNITLDNYKHLKNMNLAGFALSKSLLAYQGDKAELFKSISEEIKNW